jgi:hypothetical protein
VAKTQLLWRCRDIEVKNRRPSERNTYGRAVCVCPIQHDVKTRENTGNQAHFAMSPQCHSTPTMPKNARNRPFPSQNLDARASGTQDASRINMPRMEKGCGKPPGRVAVVLFSEQN